MKNDNKYNYVGSELYLFENAINWKFYLKSIIRKYFKSPVLEVGAGLGGTTKVFCDNNFEWYCLEPDDELLEKLEHKIIQKELPGSCHPLRGTINSIPIEMKFSTILYVDVLEHIEKDEMELCNACDRLQDGGNLILIAPAHSFLMSPFDHAIGHFRRYTKKGLNDIVPANMQLLFLGYLDSCGMIASLINKIFLRNKLPSKAQIFFWDRVMVRISMLVDRIIFFTIGKSVLGVWRKI
ncbi:MAG: class I SAM-dependent methyltransferase [Smithellaceae bacterium]